MRRQKYFLFILFLYIVSRLLILLFHPETISYELYRGTLAKELIEGLRLPWGDYLTDPYALAPLFNAFLTVPFFWVFGPTLFSLKLLPLLWHLASLVAWYFVWRFLFSPKQTFIILLFFIFAPPNIIKYFLANHGTHFELILWTALSLLILKKTLIKERFLIPGSLLLGFIGGFSNAFTLTNLVTVAVILFYVAFALTQKRKLFYFLYAIAFLVGFSPWLFYNVQHAWAGFQYPTQLFFYHITLGHLIDNFQLMFLREELGLKGLLSFSEFSRPFRLFLTFGYEGIYFLSLFILVVRKWKFWGLLKNSLDLEVFALLYQLLLFALVLISQAGWSNNYWFPLVPFMGMTIVLASERMKPILQKAVIGFCLFAGLIGSFSLLHPDHFGAVFFRQGYSYDELGALMEHNFGRDLSLFQKKTSILLHGRLSSEKQAFYQAVPDAIFEIRQEEDINKTLAYIFGVEPKFQPILFEKLGTQLGFFSEFDPKMLDGLLKKFSIPEELHPEIYRGVVLGLNHMGWKMADSFQKGLLLCRGLSSSTKPACYDGIGSLADTDYISSKIKNHAMLAGQIEAAYQPFYFQGLGRYFFTAWVDDSGRAKGFIDSLKPEEQNLFFEGLRKEISLVEDPWIRQKLLKKLGS